MAAPMLRKQSSTPGAGSTSAAAMDELYESLEIVGTGTFGVIRRIRRKADGVYLARKELNYGRMEERDMKQLSEEVNILQNLDANDYIVRYHERYVDKENTMLHIIMEFCDNGDLASLIRRCRRDKQLLPEELIWEYLTQLTLALSDCHADTDSQGRRKAVILHRDLKPENVFLDKNNRLKLGDFGLSKAMAAAAFTNTYVGTPYYMSPELINGQNYDNKSDIWALGCLIYELCAWRPPFHQAKTQAELATLIRDGRIPSLPRGYSPQLMAVIKSMLRQDPKMRPTIAQVKTLDQVKLQVRVIELRKIHDNLVREKHELTARELKIEQKERELALREKQLDFRESQVDAEKLALSEERGRLHASYATSATLLSPTLSMMPGDLSPLDSGSTWPSSSTDSREIPQNAYKSHSASREPSEDQENIPISSSNASIAINEGFDGHTLAKVASRPSLVPRRPLEERKSFDKNTIKKRTSTCSLMSLDETPVKGANNANQTDMRRRIANKSKSMHNLISGNGVSSPSRMSKSPSSDILGAFPSLPTPMPTITHLTVEKPQMTSANSDPPPRFVRRSESCMALNNSPSKRVSGINPIPLQAHIARPAPGRTSTAPVISQLPPSPRWDLEDEDNLPSPFIKKKASAPPKLSAMSRLSLVSRPAPLAPISSAAEVKTNNVRVLNAASKVSGVRSSLAGRLALNRANKADEHGRRMSTIQQSVLSTIS